VVELLDPDEEVGRALQEIPLRGVLDQDVPTDRQSTGYVRILRSMARR
jgi:cyanate lyase